jgi:parvulin-like peptidyl-prolyl isomerase
VVGGLLFAVFHIIRGPEPAADNGKTIVVDRAKLLNFMQYQSAAFRPDYFDKQFDTLTPDELRGLVDKYVREEAMFREANALGLTDGDYVIRRRMVEKMRYLIDDTASEAFHPTDAELQKFFDEHKDRYEVAPSLTFTHVFIDTERHPKDAEAVAERLKKELQAKGATFQDAPQYGDRFPYTQNYVKITPDFVQNQLGTGFIDALMKLKPSDHQWQGPIKSQFGYHVVMLTEHDPARLPKLSEIRDQVKEDMQRDRIRTFRANAVNDLVKHFTVRLEGISIPADGDKTAKATQ